MRLLLDEHFSPEIARRLRACGHDAVAVAERADLRGRADRVHFASMPEQRRAIVTRDLGDFRPLLAEALRSGSQTFGLVCVSRRFPLTHHGIGRVVRALDALLQSGRSDDAVIRRGGEVWLDDPPSDLGTSRGPAV